RTDVVASGLGQPASAIVTGLNRILDGARESGDQNTAVKSSNSLLSYFQAAAAANSFLLRAEAETAARFQEAAERLEKQVSGLLKDQKMAAELDESLADPEKEKLLVEIGGHIAAYSAGFAEVTALSEQQAPTV